MSRGSADAAASGLQTQAGTDPGTSTSSARRGPDDAPLATGTNVGRYVVLSRLGAGAMGVVYVAYDPQLDRKVAIKLLRRPIGGSADKRARQLREAQALARLTHPNVVTVYDVGTHADRTFVAMELVQGRTLTEWSRARAHGWREVLDVMLTAGEGLAAAHAANMLHRDFKPDNVMVADDGRVLVTDFGLARALEAGDESDASADVPAELRSESSMNLMTRIDLRGTPGYMAPEQHLGEYGDERIDQFGFAVTLWQTLYGQRPHAGDSVAAIAHAVMTGAVREPAADRNVPRWLRRVIERGLAVAPDDRWPSMRAFLDALRQGQRAARRTWALAALAVVAVGAIGTAGWARHREQSAAQACADEGAAIGRVWPGPDDEVRAKVRTAFSATGLGYAEDAAARTARTLDTYADDWQTQRRRACDAGRTGRDPALQAAAVACLDERGAALAALVGALQQADAAVVRRASAAADALPRLDPCADEVALGRAPTAPDEATRQRAAEIRGALSRGRSLSGAGRYQGARELIEAALADAQALDWPPLVVLAELDAGRVTRAVGDREASHRHMQAAYLGAIAVGDDESAADAASELVVIVGVHESDPDAGILWGQQAQALLRRIGEPDGMARAVLELKLAQIDRRRGDLDSAQARLEHSIALREARLGDDHPDLAGPRTNLANIHLDRAEYDQAAALYERAIADFEAARGPDHPDTAQVVNNLGAVFLRRGDNDRAQQLFERALAIRERGLGPDHPDVAQTLTNLALVRMMRGEVELATADHQRALSITEGALGPDHPEVANVLVNLAAAHGNAGHLDEAERLYRRALTIRRTALGADHPDTATVMASLAEVAMTRGDLDAARGLAADALGVVEASLGPDHPQVAWVLSLVGSLQVAAGDVEPGDAACARAEAIIVAAEGPDGFGLASPRGCRISAALARGEHRAALTAADAELTRRGAAGESPRDLASLRLQLAEAAWQSGDHDRARRAAETALAATDPRDPSDPGDPPVADQARAWLAAHPAP